MLMPSKTTRGVLPHLSTAVKSADPRHADNTSDRRDSFPRVQQAAVMAKRQLAVVLLSLLPPPISILATMDFRRLAFLKEIPLDGLVKARTVSGISPRPITDDAT